jgi:hypothetical protein
LKKKKIFGFSVHIGLLLEVIYIIDLNPYVSEPGEETKPLDILL